MSRYNHYFASFFAGCRVIAQGRDEHRNRDVTVHLLPGEFDVVGIQDGVDAWIAPVSVAPSALFDRVRRAIFALKEGKPIDTGPTPSDDPPARRRITLPPQDVVEPPSPPRRRISQEALADTQAPRSRRVISA